MSDSEGKSGNVRLLRPVSPEPAKPEVDEETQKCASVLERSLKAFQEAEGAVFAVSMFMAKDGALVIHRFESPGTALSVTGALELVKLQVLSDMNSD